MLIWVIVDAIICAAVGAIITSARGSGILVGALLGAVFGPLGVIASFAFGNRGSSSEQVSTRTTGELSDFRDCPYCAEPIRKAAIKCRYCGSAVEPVEANEVISEDRLAPSEGVPNPEEGDRIILMLVLGIGLFVAFLVIVGGVS